MPVEVDWNIILLCMTVLGVSLWFGFVLLRRDNSLNYRAQISLERERAKMMSAGGTTGYSSTGGDDESGMGWIGNIIASVAKSNPELVTQLAQNFLKKE